MLDSEIVRRDYKTLDLSRLKLGYNQYISDHQLLDGFNWKVSIDQDPVLRGIIIRLQGEMWSENLSDFDNRFPLNWWEAVKERWAPTWVKTRWPVKYHKLKLQAVFPKFKMIRPNEEYRLRMVYIEK